MGYCINLIDADFFISGQNKGKALEAIKKMAGSVSHLAWVNNNEVLESETLENAMDCFRWPLVPDDDLDLGDIVNINFEGEKSGSEDELFACLAPFVRHGSWIEVHGEDGASWRHYFMNGKLYGVVPTITWDIDKEMDVCE